MKKLKAVAWMIAWIALFAGGCGYRFSGGGDLPAGVRMVHVGILENRTSETGVETLLTNDLIYEFVRSDKSMVSGRDRAEAILTGVIQSIRTTSIAHSTQTTATERRVHLVVDLTLMSPQGERLWTVKNFSANEDYLVSDSKLITEQNKRDAIQTLSKRMAEKIYRKMTDQF